MATLAVIGELANLVSPAIEIGKCFKKQFNYLCCLKSNIQNLNHAAENLEVKGADLQRLVDEAEWRGELILPGVEVWRTKAVEIQAKKSQIQSENRLLPGFLNLKRRYSLSRNAKKTAESMVDIIKDSCNFNTVSTSRPPAATVAIAPPSGVYEFASRKKTEDDIIKAMKDGEVKVIGVCGMGGVGKTMMARRIMNRAQEKEGLFDEVVMVAVGQQVDMLKIQEEIAGWLKLKLNAKTLEPRAIHLKDRLLMGEKRRLIVIDDVWQMIDLESLGIPFNSGLCKVFLTSRDKSVLNRMDAQKLVTVGNLNKEEAWFIFKENAGACVDDSNLSSIAIEIVKKCNGLPLALVAVARALKGEVSKCIWEDALNQLISGNPIDMPHFINEIYNPIRLSYDFLESQHERSLLFLCSFFPEDYDINLEEELLYCSFGLRAFDKINNLEGTRNRIATLIRTLKCRFLILDGKDEHHVKMHDVVRDVINYIDSKEKHAILQLSSMDCWSWPNPHSESCTMLSVVPKERITELSMELSFTALRFLWMDCSIFEKIQLNDNFFKGVQQIQVLYMKSCSFIAIPQTMQLLKNIRTLHLYSCDMSLETISAVGELSNLEILICHWCKSIKKLPMEIGRLNQLKVLDVSNCYYLETIMPGVISKLVQLEELKMIHSFNGWESHEKGSDNSNVPITELESLDNLKCLEIEVIDWRLAVTELKLSSKIVKHQIIVGRPKFYGQKHPENTLTLDFPVEENLLSLGNWIQEFARSAESLWLQGGALGSVQDHTNSSSSSAAHNSSSLRMFLFGSTKDIDTFGNKKDLSIARCLTVDKLSVSSVLETLSLSSLPNLEEISYGQIPEGLRDSSVKPNKLWINISRCGKLRSLFSSSVLITSHSHLPIQTLRISDCDSMESVFSMELEEKDYGKSECITFPELESLSLRNLPSLASFCKGFHSTINIEFPRLVVLEIEYCPKLISFINIGATAAYDENHMNSASSSSAAHNHSLFCNTKQQITFGSLKRLIFGGCKKDISYLWCHHIPHLSFFAQLETLEISDCAKIHNLFSYSIAGNLVNLKTLDINYCKEMVHVIGDDINTGTTSETKPQILTFHKLEKLKLYSLPKLQSFCEGKCDLQFPSLEDVTVVYCSQMEGLTMGSVITPKMKIFHVDLQMRNVGDMIKYPWSPEEGSVSWLTAASSSILSLPSVIQPVFGNPTRGFGAAASTPPAIDHSSSSTLFHAFEFGSTSIASQPNPFMFGGQQLNHSFSPQQSPSPFQLNAEVSFSLGSGGGDKSGRKSVKTDRKKNRKNCEVVYVDDCSQMEGLTLGSVKYPWPPEEGYVSSITSASPSILSSPSVIQPVFGNPSRDFGAAVIDQSASSTPFPFGFGGQPPNQVVAPQQSPSPFGFRIKSGRKIVKINRNKNRKNCEVVYVDDCSQMEGLTLGSVKYPWPPEEEYVSSSTSASPLILSLPSVIQPVFGNPTRDFGAAVIDPSSSSTPFPVGFGGQPPNQAVAPQQSPSPFRFRIKSCRKIVKINRNKNRKKK